MLDPTDTPIPKASIALLDGEDKTVQCVETDKSGEVVLTGFPMGVSRFAVTSPGFQKRRLTLSFHDKKEVKVEVHLSVPVLGEIIDIKPRKRHGWLIY